MGWLLCKLGFHAPEYFYFPEHGGWFAYCVRCGHRLTEDYLGED